jgi:hypothetical protein
MSKGSMISTILAALLVVLVIVNIVLTLGNQSAQAELGERQQAIAQTMQLETLHRQVVAFLANMAINSNDEQIRALLSSSGIDLGGAKAQPPAATK